MGVWDGAALYVLPCNAAHHCAEKRFLRAVHLFSAPHLGQERVRAWSFAFSVNPHGMMGAATRGAMGGMVFSPWLFSYYQFSRTDL